MDWSKNKSLKPRFKQKIVTQCIGLYISKSCGGLLQCHHIGAVLLFIQHHAGDKKVDFDFYASVDEP